MREREEDKEVLRAQNIRCLALRRAPCEREPEVIAEQNLVQVLLSYCRWNTPISASVAIPDGEIIRIMTNRERVEAER